MLQIEQTKDECKRLIRSVFHMRRLLSITCETANLNGKRVKTVLGKTAMHTQMLQEYKLTLIDNL